MTEDRPKHDLAKTLLGVTRGLTERAGPRARAGVSTPAEPKTQFLGYTILEHASLERAGSDPGEHDPASQDHISSVPPTDPPRPLPALPPRSASISPGEHTRFDFAVPAPAPTVPPLVTTHIRPFSGQGDHTVAQPLAPKVAPKLALNEQDITMPQLRQSRALPIALGLLLSALILAGGFVAFRNRALVQRVQRTFASTAASVLGEERPARAAASAPALVAPALEPALAPDAPEPAPAVELAPTPALEAAPEPEPALALDAAAVADLEKKAIDRLLANDHRAALTLYEELHRAVPQAEAYSVMSALLSKRTRPSCEGGKPCDR